MTKPTTLVMPGPLRALVEFQFCREAPESVSYTHLRAHETQEVISYAVFCL